MLGIDLRLTIRLLGLVAFSHLLLGVQCGGGDDDDSASMDDDDTPDDDTDDDDTADDDTPADDDTGAVWEDVLDGVDVEGDSEHASADVMRYQHQHLDGELKLRVWSWTPFDDDDPDLTVRMYLGDGTTSYCLVQDNVSPVPSATQLWTTRDDLAIWTQVDAPGSLAMEPDTAYSMALEIEIADTALDACELIGAVEVVDGGGAGDAAPDSLWTSGHWADFVLADVLRLALDDLALDDGPGGDGDGILEPGEGLALSPAVHNDGCGPAAGPGLTGTLRLDPSSTATAVVDDLAVEYSGGDAVHAGQTALPDGSFAVQLDPGASDGEILSLILDLEDDEGHAESLALPDLRVGYPAQVATTDLVTDGDDVAAAFDIAAVSYAVTWTELQVRISSHSAHAGDQEIDVLLDVDRDGTADHLLSTYDSVTGTFSGAHYRASGDAWIREESLSTLDFAPGSSHALFGVDLARIDRPTFALLHAVAVDPGGVELDHAPDDPTDPDLLPVVDCVAEPWIEAVDTQWQELAGDGDAHRDPGETWGLLLRLRNRSSAAAPATGALVSSPDPDLVVDSPTLTFGDLAAGGDAWSLESAVLTFDAGASTAVPYHLDLALDAGAWSGTLELPLELGPRPTDTAAEAPLLGGAASLYGDADPLTDDWRDTSSCTGGLASGRDAAVALLLEAGQSLTANLIYSPGAQDAVLYLADDPQNPAGACLTGADDRTDEQETLFWTAPAEGTYYLIVDGVHEGFGGTYVLTVAL